MGVDALPRGTGVAVAVGRSVACSFVVTSGEGRPLPLEERVRAAVAQAEELHGAPPAEIRVVCVDDGSDGADLDRLARWLRDDLDVEFQVLDLVGPVASRRESDTDRSVARACEAALWSAL